MSKVELLTLERGTSLDNQLPQHFARREMNRGRRLAARTRSTWEPSSLVTGGVSTELERVACLGGLEVTWTTGWSLAISTGAMLAPNPSRVTLSRPGSWSGRVEQDDDNYGSYELQQATGVVPSPPPSPSSAGEWWVVYVVPTNATIETNSAPKVFDENPASPTYGQFVAAPGGPMAKVTGHVLTAGVLRGASHSTPDSITLPSGAIAIAWVFTPIGATDLSTAQIYDVRPLLDPGPNMIDPSSWWSNPTPGTLSSPYTDKPIFVGQVRARIRNEWVEARVTLGFEVPSLLEPGATWAGGGGIAWIYLTRVNGLVPRLMRHGNKDIGANPGFTHDFDILDGALVISPTPPLGGLTDDISSAPTAGRWDLRPSAPLTLNDIDSRSFSTVLSYFYNGMTVPQTDAICIGFLVYQSAISGVPQLEGPVSVIDGWISGNGVAKDTNAAKLGSFAKSPALPVQITTLSWTSVAPTAHTGVPFIAARAVVTPHVDTGGAVMAYEESSVPPDVVDDSFNTTGGAHVTQSRTIESPAASTTIGPGNRVVTFAVAATSGGAQITDLKEHLSGLKLPYGLPLSG